jgi:DNA repair exonuclease SbcCD nuclease subunit
MTAPYALLSDVHCHSWSQFSKTNQQGVNSRLWTILSEMARAGEELLAAGGDKLFIAGDLFHVRGKIEPSVLNPTLDLFRIMVGKGIHITVIPGNHDLEGKDASRLSNALTALEGVGVEVCNQPTAYPLDGKGGPDAVYMIPWMQNLTDLKAAALKVGERHRRNCDLVIHAPMQGVIPGLNQNALDPADVATWGYKRVFVGHYHHHVEAAPNVFSIGATTHQTWSDVGSLAGFLLVHPDGRVERRASNAPRFVELDEVPESETDLLNLVDGNYVKLKLGQATEGELKQLRDGLAEAGALGVIIQAVRDKTPITRTGAIKAGGTLTQSVSEFIQQKFPANYPLISQVCAEILGEATSVSA